MMHISKQMSQYDSLYNALTTPNSLEIKHVYLLFLCIWKHGITREVPLEFERNSVF